MLTYQDKKDNINSRTFNISEEEIKHERYGCCRYIIDITSSSKNLPVEIASLAMLYTNYFFVKNSFLNFDKRLISTASILIALKTENHQGRFAELVRIYLHKEAKINNNQNKQTILDPVKIQEASEKIALAEMSILKALKFNTRFTLPSEYIYIYTNLLIKDDLLDQILSISLKIECDSFYSLVNNLFQPYVVALSCIVIAQELIATGKTLISDENLDLENLKIFYLGTVKLIHDKSFNKSSLILGFSNEEFNLNFLNFDDDTFQKYKNQYTSDSLVIKLENKCYDNTFYDELPWYKKLHPSIQQNDIYSSISLILEYYEDMKVLLLNK